MKKKLFMSGIAIVAIAGLVFGKNCLSNRSNAIQDLLLQNVEALSSDEDSPCSYRLFPCYTSAGTQCTFSQNTDRQVCCTLTYCR